MFARGSEAANTRTEEGTARVALCGVFCLVDCSQEWRCVVPMSVRPNAAADARGSLMLDYGPLDGVSCGVVCDLLTWNDRGTISSRSVFMIVTQ